MRASQADAGLGNDASRTQIPQPIAKALLTVVGLVKAGLMDLYGADENRRRGVICTKGKAEVCVVVRLADDLFQRIGRQIMTRHNALPKVLPLH